MERAEKLKMFESIAEQNLKTIESGEGHTLAQIDHAKATYDWAMNHIEKLEKEKMDTDGWKGAL